jgi:hypothetical protein
MTPEEVVSRLAGDPTYDMWDKTKQLWFCGRVVEIQSEIESMKDPAYAALLAKLKSSLRKTIAALGPLHFEAASYLAGGLPPPNMEHAIEELWALDKTAKRLLAMPKPNLIELTTATDDDPWGGVSAGGERSSRFKWRNDVATAMVHDLIEESDVKIVTTMGSPSMRLVARVLDCLQRRGRPRKTETARKRLARPKGKSRREK